MTKNELIKQLELIKGNPQVFLASDEEGNSFNELTNVELDYAEDFDIDSLGEEVIILWV